MDIICGKSGDKNWDNVKRAVTAVEQCGRAGQNIRSQVFSSDTNDFITELYASSIRSEILKRVNSKYFSICTMRFQFPIGMLVLFVRYLHKAEDGQTLCVRQDFLGFVNNRSNDEKYEERLKKAIGGYGLDLQKMRGFVHDYKDDRLTGGVIDAIYTQALCTGNYAKSENTTLMHLMFSSTFDDNVSMLYDSLSDMGKYIWTAFGSSDIFFEMLQNSPRAHLQSGKRLVNKLAKENHNFFSDVKKVLSPIISTIREVEDNGSYPSNRTVGPWSSNEPCISYYQIQTFEFIAVAFIFDSIVAHVTNISKDLHKPNVDLVALMKRVDVAINGLAKAREESEATFKPIFEAINNFCDQNSIKKGLDPLAFMMSYSEDIKVRNSDDLEKIVRECTYEKLLDGVIDQLKMRFNERYRQAVLCQRLIPSFIGGTDDETSYCESLECVLMLYEKDIDMKVKVLDEIKKWRLHWFKISLDARPKNVIQTLSWIKEHKSFTNVKTLLEIFAILPMADVSKVVSEIPKVRRHFKCAITWGRGYLGNDGLGLLYFHPDIAVNTDQVIQSVVDSGKISFN